MSSPPDRPAPLSALPDAAARGVRGVLTDIDDTLTDAGGIDPRALAALEALRAAGIPVVAITGRPKGWSEPFARDSAGRVTDIAVDHSEFEHLTPAQVEQVVAAMRAEGLHATVSSIHVNGWYGDHDKLSGARWIVRRRLGRDLDAERGHWVYVGDSTNDQLMFGAFELSVGVANLMRFAAELQTWPAYLAQGERGAGFAEVARRILEGRR